MCLAAYAVGFVRVPLAPLEAPWPPGDRMSRPRRSSFLAEAGRRPRMQVWVCVAHIRGVGDSPPGVRREQLLGFSGRRSEARHGRYQG